MILRLSDIKINSEFENLLPAPSMEQFKQLEENMVAEGRARNPLVTWKNHDILLDGHNRMRILKAHPELTWTFIEQEFADEDEVKEWIIKNALGTRNLTEPQVTELRGRLYNMRKSKRGGDRKSTPQKGELKGRTRGASDELATELGVSHHSIENAGNFVDGLDAAEAVVPGFASEVRSGAVKAQKQEIAAMRKQTPEEIKKSIKDIRERKGLKRKPTDKSFNASLRKLDAAMSGVATPSYTINDLLNELDVITDEFLRKFVRTIDVRSDIIESYTNGAEQVLSAVDNAIEKMKNMKGRICK